MDRLTPTILHVFSGATPMVIWKGAWMKLWTTGNFWCIWSLKALVPGPNCHVLLAKGLFISRKNRWVYYIRYLCIQSKINILIRILILIHWGYWLPSCSRSLIIIELDRVMCKCLTPLNIILSDRFSLFREAPIKETVSFLSSL